MAVKQQVESQIKVRDMSRTAVTIAPAEYASWHEARADLMQEAKVRVALVPSFVGSLTCVLLLAQTGLKAQLEAELAAQADDAGLEALRAKFSEKERALEHAIDHTAHTFTATLDLSYNFLAK